MPYRPRGERIKGEESVELELVLIVIKLRANPAALQPGDHSRRIGIPHLKGELMPGHLRNEQPFQSSVGGELQYGRIDKLIAARKHQRVSDVSFCLEFDAGRSSASKVLSSAGDQIGSYCQRDICNRARDL